jgi:hypothetical protein
VKELIPALQERRLVLLDHSPKSIDLFPAEPVAPLQPHRIEPELCFAIVALDVNMGRLVPITCVEEETEGSTSEYGWHKLIRG